MPSALLDYLPLWTFFAPNPGPSDIRLLFHGREAAGRPGPWLECSREPTINAWRWVWNPQKLEEKSVIDLALLLCRQLRSVQDEAGDPDTIVLSWPYLVLLAKTMAQPATAGEAERQFCLLATQGLVPPRSMQVLYVSRWHGLE